MERNEDRVMEDAELTEGLCDVNAKDVIADFGGQTVAGFREKIDAVPSSMDLMFTFSVIGGKGFGHFLPAIDDYARSLDSEFDCEFPGSIAHAIANQMRINPAAVFACCEQVESLSRYLLGHLEKFGQDEEWRLDTAKRLERVLSAVTGGTPALLE